MVRVIERVGSEVLLGVSARSYRISGELKQANVDVLALGWEKVMSTNRCIVVGCIVVDIIWSYFLVVYAQYPVPKQITFRHAIQALIVD